jgi:hypothetical protein
MAEANECDNYLIGGTTFQTIIGLKPGPKYCQAGPHKLRQRRHRRSTQKWADNWSFLVTQMEIRPAKVHLAQLVSNPSNNKQKTDEEEIVA